MIRKADIQKVINTQNIGLTIDNNFIQREIMNNFDMDLPYAIIIKGVRRCGKSTFLKQIMQSINSPNYISFEDIRLNGFEPNDFEKLDMIFDEAGQSDYYFFDEIQNIESWEIFIRQKLDQNKKVIITGSNASLLSRELGTRLTGRHIDYEMFPFTFREYLNYKSSEPNPDSFAKYLTLGGFPEYIQFENDDILRNLLSDILIRDIAIRHGIRNTKLLLDLTVYFLSNLSKTFSFQSLRKTFNVGSTSTIIDYISFLEDSYLLFSIPKFDYSLKKQAYNPKKIYCIDNGLAKTNSLSHSSEKGHLLENMVFLDLRRKHSEIYYFVKTNECDFVIRENGEITKVIQVCYEITPDNKLREINGLIEAMTFFNLSTGTIITHDEEDILKTEGKEIQIIPAWKWLLQG